MMMLNVVMPWSLRTCTGRLPILPNAKGYINLRVEAKISDN